MGRRVERMFLARYHGGFSMKTMLARKNNEDVQRVFNPCSSVRNRSGEAAARMPFEPVIACCVRTRAGTSQRTGTPVGTSCWKYAMGR